MSSGQLLSSFRAGSVWRSTWLHLGLLALALAGAWVSYSRPFDDEGASATRGAIVVQAAEGDVERIVHERPARAIEIEAREDDLGRWFAGRETVAVEDVAGGAESADDNAAEDAEDADVSAEDADADAETASVEGAEPAEGAERAERSAAVFAGGSQVAAVWAALEPLRAVRVLEGVGAGKLEELELAGESATAEFLTLTVRGREIRYRLGGRPFGGADRYARREPGRDGDAGPRDRVLVLPSELVAGLSGGAGLMMERRLLAASRPEVESMTLVRPGSPAQEPLRIVQRTGANLADGYWTAGGSGEPNADVAAWVDKFFRLSAAAYRSGEPAPDWRLEATVAVESREHGNSTLRIWSVPGETPEDARVWLAQSPFTRLVAELSAPLAEEDLRRPGRPATVGTAAHRRRAARAASSAAPR